MRFTSALAIGLLLTAAGPARGGGAVAVNAWGAVIDKPGSYKLTADITAPKDGAAGIGITIKAEDVTLDLDGHAVTGRLDDEGRGQGIGIAVEGTASVEIDGGGSTVSKCRTGVEINRCKQVALSSVYVHGNMEGVLVISADKVRIEHVEWKDNRGDALVLLECSESVVSAGAIRSGGTGIGINRSEDVRIERVHIGGDKELRGGVGIIKSPKVELIELTIGRCATGVVIRGAESKDNEIRKCKFGQPEDNDCDLKVTDKAEEPMLIGNEPAKLKRCD